MKVILKYGLLWSIIIGIYILQLILVCVNGATLINSICAWGSCIFLVLLLAINYIKRVYDSEKELNDLEKQIKEIDERITKYKDENNKE